MPFSWPQFAYRYRQAIAGRQERVRALAQRVANGTVTLLCSCAERRCHRILLKELVEKALRPQNEGGRHAPRT